MMTMTKKRRCFRGASHRIEPVLMKAIVLKPALAVEGIERRELPTAGLLSADQALQFPWANRRFASSSRGRPVLEPAQN